MASPSALVRGLVKRFLPSPFAEGGDDQPIRLRRYGEVGLDYAAPTKHALVDEGCYMMVTNPTVSTGMTQVAAQTTFVDTTPNMYIYNPEVQSNPNAKSIYLDYIKMIATAAATAATAIHYAIVLDTVARNLSTDNTQSLTPVNPNGNASNILAPTVKWQNSATASVIVASSASKRLVGRGVLGGLNVAGDEMVIVFGSTDVGATAGLTAAQAAALSRRVSNSPGIVIGPGQSLVLHLWAPSSSASWNPELEIGFWAR